MDNIDDKWFEDEPVPLGRDMLQVDPAFDREPGGVAERRRMEDAFVHGTDTVEPTPAAKPVRTSEWDEVIRALSPGTMQLLRRRPPELEQLLSWLQHIGAYKDARGELQLKIGPIQVSFPFVTMQKDAMTEVYLLPHTSSGIKMEMGTDLSVLSPGDSRPVIFIGCFELPQFPFKFLLLGSPPSA
jgi:hypothetical protein